jgi:hypothetical protein
MENRVYLYQYGEGKLLGGRIFSVTEATRRAKQIVKTNRGQMIELRNIQTDGIVKTVV